MNEQMGPALRAAGFSTSDTPFRRDAIKYVFRRVRADGAGADVIEVMFNRTRAPRFAVQMYVDPPEGLEARISGAGLILAGLSSAAIWWPRGVTSFRATPGLWQRLRGHRASDVNRPVREFIALLPLVNRWFAEGTRSRRIIVGRLRRS